MENKNSYFLLDLKISDNDQNEIYHDKLNDSVDLILSSMRANHDSYKFKKIDDSRIIYFFKTNKRKRKGQLTKFCERFLPKEQIYEAKRITKSYLKEQILRLKKK
nr:hypothetical protein [Naviculales sp.]